MNRQWGKSIILYGLCLLALGVSFLASRVGKVDSAQECQTFPQTGKSVCGEFLQYWSAHGGVEVQGYPISEQMEQRSSADGSALTVQFFEKAMYELHADMPEGERVQLVPLGAQRFQALYPKGAPASLWDHARESRFFSETGFYVEEPFLGYFLQHGGVEVMGYPISKPFVEVSSVDGKPYTVQYFENVEIELHPENPQFRYQIL